MRLSHDHVPELPEQVSLKGLSKEITNHLQRRAMADHDALGLNPDFHPEVSDVDMPQFGPRGHATLSFQLNRTLVILIEDVLRNFISLCFKEILDANRVTREVITRANKLRFSGALRVELLFG